MANPSTQTSRKPLNCDQLSGINVGDLCPVLIPYSPAPWSSLYGQIRYLRGIFRLPFLPRSSTNIDSFPFYTPYVSTEQYHAPSMLGI